jgi:hypothetical protein
MKQLLCAISATLIAIISSIETAHAASLSFEQLPPEIGEVEVSFTLKWDFNPDPPKIWLNGKECRPHDFFNIDPHINKF